MRMPGLALLLVACTGGERVELTDVNVSECLNPVGSDDPVPPEELILSGVEGAIIVSHRAHELPCQPDIDIEARTFEEGVVEVRYDNRNKDSTNCGCVYDLAYTLGPLADGTWIVRVPSAPAAQAVVD